jgi:hypothetical protein
MIETADFEPKNIGEMRVNMPFLRRFSLQEPISVGWGLSVLQMVDAPSLEAFALNLDQPQTLPDPIPFYIAYGREVNTGEGQPEAAFPRRPIYPTLKHLALGPFTGTSISLLAMLESLGTITRLDWELEDEEPVSINRVLGNFKVCPRLEHLRVHGVHWTDLVDLIESRIRNGVPLKVVEVNSRDWSDFPESIIARLSNDLQLKTFGSYVDENESDSDTSTSDSDSTLSSDSDEWTDTDRSNADDHEDNESGNDANDSPHIV